MEDGADENGADEAPRAGRPVLPGEPGQPEAAVLPGFREMALRRMAAERATLVRDLIARRQAAGMSQTEVAARMGTSQSAVARLEAGASDVRASTLERYAAAIGGQIAWRPAGAGLAAADGGDSSWRSEIMRRTTQSPDGSVPRGRTGQPEPGWPGMQGTPDVPGTPGVPGTPRTPGSPETPGKPWQPGPLPGAPGPGTPGAVPPTRVWMDPHADWHDQLYARLLAKRIVMASGVLDEEAATRLSAQLLTLDAEGGEPIRLELQNLRADLSAALAVMGVLDVVRAPVHAQVSGEIRGPAIGVLAACPRRLAYPNAAFAFSEPRLELGGTVTAVTERQQQAERMLDSLYYRIAEATGRDANEVREDARRGRTLTTAEAIGFGLIHERASSRPE